MTVAPEEFVQAPVAPGSSGPPKVFYLAYADGKTPPRNSPNPCRDTAPKFVCDFAPTLAECQRQIQVYLDRWYADLNVVFTLTRPTSGAYYTEVISSGGGAWCGSAANVAGVAPFLCDDIAGGVAYTFLGGKNAKETAVIIAQEQAHLVGLEHTLSARDIMDPTICPNCDGFENVDNQIQNDHCGRSRQNSYQMIKDRLGTWSGGIKPTPFGCQPDLAPPQVDILTPANNSAVGDSFLLRVQASDQCSVSRVTVSVAPMGLHAESTAGPFEWTLSRITGVQTITVTAFDPSGKQTSSSVTVRTGGAVATGGAGGSPGGATGMGGLGGAGGSVAELGTAPASGCQLGGCGIMGREMGPGSSSWWMALAASLATIGLALASRRSSRNGRRCARASDLDGRGTRRR